MIAAATALAVAVSACAPTNTGTTYSHNQLGRPSTVEYGTIVAANEVTVDGSHSGVGTAVGAGAGAVAGSAIGRSTRANILGGIGGAVLGGLIGYGAEQALTSGKAVQFTVRRHDGSEIAVVQTNEERLQVGDQVQIITGDKTRLVRTANAPAYGYSNASYPPPAPAPAPPQPNWSNPR